MHELASQQAKRLVAELEVKTAAHVNAYEQWNKDLISNEAYNEVGRALAEARNELLRYLHSYEHMAALGRDVVQHVRFQPNGVGVIKSIAIWDRHVKGYGL